MKKRQSKLHESYDDTASTNKHTSTANLTFIPFETRARPHANTPLSMHSAIMAIHAALSAARAGAPRAASLLEPCFKLPGDPKHKARLRRATLARHVERVCAEAAAAPGSGTAGQRAQEWDFEEAACGSDGAAPQRRQWKPVREQRARDQAHGYGGARAAGQRVSPYGWEEAWATREKESPSHGSGSRLFRLVSPAACVCKKREQSEETFQLGVERPPTRRPA